MPQESNPNTPIPDLQPLNKMFLGEVMKNYWGPMYHYVMANPSLKKTITGFLINPRSVAVYVGRTHIALEYFGSEVLDQNFKPEGVLEIETYDFTHSDINLLEQIIGYKSDSTAGIEMPLTTYMVDFICPTNKGFDKLQELGWNMAAQNSIISLNGPIPTPIPNRFSRLINGRFFDADEAGLLTRHVKWMDFFPIIFDPSDKEVDTIKFSVEFLSNGVEPDAHFVYPAPQDYKFKKLPSINRFVELWGNNSSSETDITSFLNREDHQFILTMKFGATAIKSEATCEWQSEQRNAIRPDFFVLQPNGFADIVEFKLPDIGKSTVVGSANRETFSAWLSSYISQTRVYATYFDDPNNRRWFENKYGFKVYKPRRWLVVGRRSDFSSDVWREIQSDYRDLEILTFDDLIDGTTAQFYK